MSCLDLLQTIARYVQFFGWCFLRLFHKAVQHHDIFVDQSAEKDSGDSFSTFEPQFKQTATKGVGMRQT
jgi:hypothetical protein